MALAAQGFARPRPAVVGTRQLNLALARMATLQIDSVNVFARSHYLPLFSRLGPYDPALLERLLFARRGPYTEYWAHVASFIPTADWGLFAFRHEDLQVRYGQRADRWFHAHRGVVDDVRAQLAARGPLRPAQIEHAAKTAPTGAWWDWDVVKRSLEYLWLFGEVAVAGRRGFERRYGLVADVIPDAARVPVPRADAIRELVARAAAAYGVATATDLADYWRIADRAAVLQAVSDLVDAGTLEPVAVEGWERAGRALPAWRHRDATLPRRVEAATVLTPFDPLVWFRDRAERLFDFEYRIEIYTPANKRRYGYYSLPVLVGDDVVGRVDLKADRAGSTLLVQSAWWEHGRPGHAADRLAEVLRSAARWQGLERVSIGRWGDAADDVAAALGAAFRHDRPAVAEPVAATVEV
ncbi:winged helix-turn-helix domain-containing protein [Microbacterium sp. zg.B96]|nr:MULTISPECIES: crosslink repair DNA glycosylase YcaQ family protein [unclassified Microbacterium]MCR2784354.1 winged helix DNA-binding domain-containing protein [Microbacterium sp. zg.B96]MDL5350738.1 crosslink repair DNA glycosylase YcaQ family protein [Microbacterium sp. zg-YB36]WIM17614.1 crosslink repair DNA glycosylase YcaQ family protein [Microbacterium sp. zg-B96]